MFTSSNFVVDGYYEDWGQWENCTVICGGGTKTRRRTCIEPMYGGANCTGPSEEDTDCNTHNCPGKLFSISQRNNCF